MAIFQPKTLRDALQPIISIYWFFGMGIIEYPVGKPRTILSVIFSLVIFVFCGSVYCISYVHYFPYENASNLSLFIFSMKIFLVVNFALCFANVVASIVFNKEQIDCLAELTEIDASMKKIGISRSYRSVLLRSMLQLTGCTIFYFSKCVSTYLVFRSDPNINEYLVGLIIITEYFDLVTISGNLLFSTVNWLIVEYVKDLNTLLKSMRIQYSDSFNITMSNIIRVESVRRHKKKLETIRRIRKIYFRLTDVAQSWTKIKTAHIISSTVGTTWTILFLSYDIFHGVTQQPNYLTMSFQFPLQLMKLNMLVSNSSALASEVKRTVGILLRYLQSIEYLRTEARDFAFELTDNPIYLSPAALFYMNKSLIGRIAMTVLTCLVMLIQGGNEKNLHSDYRNSSAR